MAGPPLCVVAAIGPGQELGRRDAVFGWGCPVLRELPELGPWQSGRADRRECHADAMPGPGRGVPGGRAVVDDGVLGVVVDAQELVVLASFAVVGVALVSELVGVTVQDERPALGQHVLDRLDELGPVL